MCLSEIVFVSVLTRYAICHANRFGQERPELARVCISQARQKHNTPARYTISHRYRQVR